LVLTASLGLLSGIVNGAWACVTRTGSAEVATKSRAPLVRERIGVENDAVDHDPAGTGLHGVQAVLADFDWHENKEFVARRNDSCFWFRRYVIGDVPLDMGQEDGRGGADSNDGGSPCSPHALRGALSGVLNRNREINFDVRSKGNAITRPIRFFSADMNEQQPSAARQFDIPRRQEIALLRQSKTGDGPLVTDHRASDGPIVRELHLVQLSPIDEAAENYRRKRKAFDNKSFVSSGMPAALVGFLVMSAGFLVIRRGTNGKAAIEIVLMVVGSLSFSYAANFIIHWSLVVR
jgi:hypothetical protein